MRAFVLPSIVAELVLARNRLRDHFASSGLTFTIDGNLVGDIGEAIAAQLFGIRLVSNCATGIDGHAPDGRTVQVKTTGTGRGPAFRNVDTRAEHLLFFMLDFDQCIGEVVYNGPEHLVVHRLQKPWIGQRAVPLSWMRGCNLSVADADRLAPF